MVDTTKVLHLHAVARWGLDPKDDTAGKLLTLIWTAMNTKSEPSITLNQRLIR